MKGSIFAIAVNLLILMIGGTAMALELKSDSFFNGGAIPSKYTCDGADISPPLAWSGIPGGTKSLALISDDPDAPVGTWVHWVAWNIPGQSGGLKEGVEKSPKLADGTLQGINDFRRHGYGGPCPPSGTHRYFFKLYALDTNLNIPATSRKKDLEAAMKGHVLAETALIGTYSRR